LRIGRGAVGDGVAFRGLVTAMVFLFVRAANLRLGDDAIAAHADEAVRARLAAQGFEVSGVTGAAFAQSIDQQFERWAKIVKATGFSATE